MGLLATETGNARLVTTTHQSDGFVFRMGELIHVVNGAVPAALESCSIPHDGPLPPTARRIDMAEVAAAERVRNRPYEPPVDMLLTRTEVLRKFNWTDEQLGAAFGFAFPRGMQRGPAGSVSWNWFGARIRSTPGSPASAVWHWEAPVAIERALCERTITSDRERIIASMPRTRDVSCALRSMSRSTGDLTSLRISESCAGHARNLSATHEPLRNCGVGSSARRSFGDLLKRWDKT